MAKKNGKNGKSSVVGKIITVVLIVLLIAGGYYLYSMFKSVEITPANLAGTWKDTDGKEVGHWNFTAYCNNCGVRNDVEPEESFEDAAYTWVYLSRGSGEYYEKTITGSKLNNYKFDYCLYERTAKKGGQTVTVMRIQPEGYNDDGTQKRGFDITINSVSRAQVKYMKGTGTYTSWTNENLF
ncbi:MAG: hypothetical protein MJ105_01510 [Lachnospiraceae bacterium]|nr:hypothetical protein [Lachnospiraceae bacterium]